MPRRRAPSFTHIIMQLRLATLTLTTLLLLSRAFAADDAGFTPLFNVKDFTGWRFSGQKEGVAWPANWTVAEGMIRLTGGGKPNLVTVREYGDFEMIFEWRALKDKYNSGFYIRSGKDTGSNQLNLAKGAEGGLVGGKVEGAKAVPELQNKPGEWNTWRVLVKGDKVSFWCNDKLAWEGSGIKPARGHIGFQAEGAAIDFRNLRLQELK